MNDHQCCSPAGGWGRFKVIQLAQIPQHTLMAMKRPLQWTGVYYFAYCCSITALHSVEMHCIALQSNACSCIYLCLLLHQNKKYCPALNYIANDNICLVNMGSVIIYTALQCNVNTHCIELNCNARYCITLHLQRTLLCIELYWALTIPIALNYIAMKNAHCNEHIAMHDIALHYICNGQCPLH